MIDFRVHFKYFPINLSLKFAKTLSFLFELLSFFFSFEFFLKFWVFSLSSEDWILEFTFSLEFSRSSWRIIKSFSTSQSMVICYAVTHLVYQWPPMFMKEKYKREYNFSKLCRNFQFWAWVWVFSLSFEFFPLEYFFSRWPNQKPALKALQYVPWAIFGPFCERDRSDGRSLPCPWTRDCSLEQDTCKSRSPAKSPSPGRGVPWSDSLPGAGEACIDSGR